MKRLLIALLMVSLCTSIALAAKRTWTSSNGKFTVEAELIGFADGKVKLKKANGKVIEVPLKSLSEADRKFVEQQYSEDEKKSDEKAGKPKSSEDKKPLTPAPPEKETPEEDADDAKRGVKEIELTTLELEPPNQKSRRSVSLKSYLLQLVRPITIRQKNKEAAGKFKAIVKKEPTYVVPIPVRGTVRFGGKDYAFALDAKSKKADGYDTLYFDADGDGDLTNDPTTKAFSANKANKFTSMSYFPVTKVTLNVDGKSIDYAFLLNTYCTLQNDKFNANVSVYAAAAREGYIQFGKKRSKVVLIDRNSNGRFDDGVSIQSNGQLSEGDMLLINPDPKKGASGSGNDSKLVGKVLCFGKDYYRVTIAPDGVKMSLEPMEVETGCVCCSNFAYQTILASDDYGVIVLAGGKGQEMPLAEGEWKVVNYKLLDGGRSWLEARYGKRPTVTVKKGETAPLPFGGAYRAVVTGGRSGQDKVYLRLAIVGPNGEQCRGIYVNGKRPPKPKFVIKTTDGEVAHQGNFEYG